MCGEKSKSAHVVFLSVGSPPRVRGKESGLRLWISRSRITPACAGKSFPYSPSCVSPWDHPRVCGEKMAAFRMGAPVTGSPPRVRGKDLNAKRSFRRQRITPACAGKRLISWAELTGTAGSPPRVRGKVSGRVCTFAQNRITPACAGKSPLPYPV